MNENQSMHDNIMSKEVDMNEQNEDETSVKSKHVDCFDAFNTSQVLICFFVVKVINECVLKNKDVWIAW